jgi:uncharacterized protein YqgC (DUF456 family)
MTGRYWIGLSPAILVALAIIVCTAIAVRTSHSAWMVLVGPLLMALAIVGADVLASRLRGKPSGPSWGALILGTALLVACVILAFGNPTHVASMMPILGGGAGAIVVSRSVARRYAC